ncbi:MAG: LysR family transcriptional regulator, partial [Desulfobacterales bacterium]|nr:LysR family transcriptional regulator [Desulfobacterales bacterium]
MLPPMEFYHLQSFVTVANEGSITRAAQRLNITPPTISGHIKALEEEFLIRLFQRKPRGMALTNQGQLLLEQAERVMASARRLQNQAAELRDCVSGKFTIG